MVTEVVGSQGRSGGSRKQGHDLSNPDGSPTLPRGTSKDVAAKWKLLTRQIPFGVLRRVDAHQLGALARLLVLGDSLWARIEAKPDDIAVRRLFIQNCAQLGRLSAQFGLSPSDRQRLRIEPVIDEDDEFEKWQQGRETKLDMAEIYKRQMNEISSKPDPTRGIIKNGNSNSVHTTNGDSVS